MYKRKRTTEEKNETLTEQNDAAEDEDEEPVNKKAITWGYEHERQTESIRTIPGTPTYKAGAHLRRALGQARQLLTCIEGLMGSAHDNEKWQQFTEDADLCLSFCDTNLDLACEYFEQSK